MVNLINNIEEAKKLSEEYGFFTLRMFSKTILMRGNLQIGHSDPDYIDWIKYGFEKINGQYERIEGGEIYVVYEGIGYEGEEEIDLCTYCKKEDVGDMSKIIIREVPHKVENYIKNRDREKNLGILLDE